MHVAERARGAVQGPGPFRSIPAGPRLVRFVPSVMEVLACAGIASRHLGSGGATLKVTHPWTRGIASISFWGGHWLWGCSLCLDRVGCTSGAGAVV